MTFKIVAIKLGDRTLFKLMNLGFPYVNPTYKMRRSPIAHRKFLELCPHYKMRRSHFPNTTNNGQGSKL
ncbi:MAG: hypothetical protein ACYT04_42355 [Nostoc sp.]